MKQLLIEAPSLILSIACGAIADEVDDFVMGGDPATTAEAAWNAPPPVNADKLLKKITHGDNADPKQFPFQVALIRSSAPNNDPFRGFYCGGTLLNWRWVLTAAHCTFKANPLGVTVKMTASDLKIYVGSVDFTGGELIPVAAGGIRVHENYVKETNDNDLALIQLDREPSDESKPVLRHVTLTKPSEAGRIARNQNVTAVGWGSTVQGVVPIAQRKAVQRLQYVGVTVQDSVSCNDAQVANIRNNAYKYFIEHGKTDHEAKAARDAKYPLGMTRVTSNMFCAGNPNEFKDACFGDSGGPLLVKIGNEDVQAGIISWGPAQGCAIASLSGVYVRVDRYRDWITGIAGPLN